MLEDLKKLLNIESLPAKPEDGAPFGKPLRKTLESFLDTARSYGLKTENLNGYCGWAEIGSGEKCIGILCHLDTVPAGGGWSYPPYDLTVDNGRLYGRGVADDKGPAVAVLHVLKRLKDENVKLSRRIRLIVGCNEESGSECMKYYVRHAEIPEMSFVPDADFPVIGSEKGILHMVVKIPADASLTENLTFLRSGDRPNVVPDRAEAGFTKNCKLYKKLKDLCGGGNANDALRSPEIITGLLGEGFDLADFSINDLGGEIRIETRGIAGHAMAPDKGDNAVFKLFALLNTLLKDESGETVKSVTRLLCTPLSSERLGIACSDEKSGKLTINFGAVKLDGNMLEATLDLRLPLCADKDEIIGKITGALPKGTTAETLHYAPNLYADENGKLVQTLLKVYSSVTGKEPFIVKSGGGTYARELPNAVAFGPTFPGAETNIHNADESLSIEEFEKLGEIYYKAIIELDKI